MLASRSATTTDLRRRRLILVVAEQTALIGRRIAEGREAAGMTQAELAAEIPGKSDGTQVSKWERGVHRPSDKTLEHIARIVKRDYVWFLTPDREELETPDLFGAGEPTQLDRIENKLDRLILLLTPRPIPAAEPEIPQPGPAVLPTGEAANSNAKTRRQRKTPPAA